MVNKPGGKGREKKKKKKKKKCRTVVNEVVEKCWARSQISLFVIKPR